MQNTNLREMNIHIDYYCFPTQTGDISVFTNLDQYTDFRERSHYERTLKEVNQAREKGKLILFDLQKECFINEKCEKVDLVGKVIFPRSTISAAGILVENIEKAGGKSITSKQDYNEIVENWFKKVKTRREYVLTTMRELQSNLDAYEKNFGQSFFVKTVQKGYSGICIIFEMPVNEIFPQNKILMDSHFHSLSMSIRNPETPILIYKRLEILKDSFGKREWRAFVVNDELLSLSRCSDDGVQIEEYVYKKVKEKLREFKGLIPSSYVVDFFEYNDDDSTVFDVVEFNPIIASGTFANNDVVF